MTDHTQSHDEPASTEGTVEDLGLVADIELEPGDGADVVGGAAFVHFSGIDGDGYRAPAPKI
jgi:hypothetical protein